MPPRKRSGSPPAPAWWAALLCQAQSLIQAEHVHLIPRYAGDVPDPRGGIQCVLAGKRPTA